MRPEKVDAVMRRTFPEIFKYPEEENLPPLVGYGDTIKQGELFIEEGCRFNDPLILRHYDLQTKKFFATSTGTGTTITGLLEWPGGGITPPGRRTFKWLARWRFMTDPMKVEAKKWHELGRAGGYPNRNFFQLTFDQLIRYNAYGLMAWLDWYEDKSDRKHSLTSLVRRLRWNYCGNIPPEVQRALEYGGSDESVDPPKPARSQQQADPSTRPAAVPTADPG